MPPSKKFPAAVDKPVVSRKEPAALASGVTDFINPWANPHLVSYFSSVRARFGNLRVLQIATYKETRRDFHIDDLFVRPALSEKYIPLAEAESTPSFGSDLLSELQEHRRLVILGDPGSGKSTIVNWIAWSLASTESHRPLNLAFKDYVPLPIVLREAQVPDLDGPDLPSLDSIFAVFLSQRFTEPLRDKTELLQDLFRRGQIFFLFDGIDELSSSKREWLRYAWISILLTERDPYTPAVLTSRIVGYDCSGFENAEFSTGESGESIAVTPTRRKRKKKDGRSDDLNLEVSDLATKVVRAGLESAFLHQKPLVRRYSAPFDQLRIREYSRNWYRLRDRREAESTADAFLAALEENTHLRELRHSPLLLTFMAIVYNVRRRLPDGRVLVYKEIVQAFLETIPLEKNLPVEFSPDTVREALALLAWKAQILRDLSEDTQDKTDRGILLPESIVRESMRQGLSRTMGSEASDTVVEALIDYCKNRTGLLIPRGVPPDKNEEHYAFAHLSFQEYLASQHLLLQLGNEWSRRQVRREGFSRVDLHRLAARENWRETFILLFESMSEQVGALNPAAFAGYLFDARMANESRGFSLVDWSEDPYAAELPKLSIAKKPDDVEVTVSQLRRLHLLVALLVDTRVAFPLALRENLLRSTILLLPIAEPVADHVDAHFPYRRRNATLASMVLSSPLLREVFFAFLNELQPSELNLGGTRLADLSPLSKLSSLQSLDLSGTQAIDLAPLSKLCSLQLLNLGGAQVTNLRSLSKLSSLQSLGLSGTNVSDISPLSKLSELQSLNLIGTKVSNLSPLSKLSSLQSLNLSGTQITDLSQISKILSLRTLDLSGTRTIDISPIAEIIELQTLRLSGTQIVDLSPISKLFSLQFLSLLYTPVSNILPLANLTALRFVDLDSSKVSDLSSLSNLSSLYSLDIRSTPVTDLSPLSTLPSLQTLFLNETQVLDLSPLSALSSLRSLFIPDTNVADLSPLFNLKNLQLLAIQNTLASRDKGQLSKLRRKLPKCTILEE